MAAQPPNSKPAAKIVVIHALEKTDIQGNVIYETLHVGQPALYVDLNEAHKITGLSVRHLSYLCSIGDFKTAHKPGKGERAQWRIARSEVLGRRSVRD